MFSKVIKAIVEEIKNLIEFFICYFPESRSGRFLRIKYWNYKLNNKGGSFEFASRINRPELFEIDDYFAMGRGVLLWGHLNTNVFIGKNVSISHNSYLVTANHSIDDISMPITNQGYDYKTINYNNKEYNIVIEDDVWIAANCVILPGTHLGKGCVVSAGSIVSGIFKDYSVIMGNPARVLKTRKTNE